MEKKDDKYERILKAVAEVFAQNGFGRSTVSQIAKEAGVADGTIYLYFIDKGDLITQFFHVKEKQMFARFRDAVNQADSATERLRNRKAPWQGAILSTYLLKSHHVCVVFIYENNLATKTQRHEVELQ